MVRAFDVIGKSTPRVDGALKVTGKAKYAADVPLDNVLWGKALMSPYAHARIKSIDTSAAKALPGVRAVITGLELMGHNLAGRTLRDIPLLAGDTVRFVGERVAAVAAVDEDTAQMALDLIEVEYEELAAVFDAEEAALPGAPILHPGYNDYPGVREKQETPTNVFVKRAYNHGDFDAGMAAAEVVVENTYRTQQQHPGYMEPQAALVWDDKASGRVKVWTCTKAPYRNKEPTAFAFDITEEQILIEPVYVGGDFGGKSFPMNVPIAYQLSKATGQPVRMVSEYLEELMGGQPNQYMVFKLKTGLKRDGTMTAHSVEHFANCGAYAGYKPGGAMGGANQAAGPLQGRERPASIVQRLHQHAAGSNLPGAGRASGDLCARVAHRRVRQGHRHGLGGVPAAQPGRVGRGVGGGRDAGRRSRVKDVLQLAVEASGLPRPQAGQRGQRHLRGRPGSGRRPGDGRVHAEAGRLVCSSARRCSTRAPATTRRSMPRSLRSWA